MGLLSRSSLPKGAGIHLFVLFFLSPLYMLAQSPKEIRGTVKDSTGIPVPGISVTVKQSNLTAVTNTKGFFVIGALPGDVLQFSGVGFSSKEVTVTGDLLYNVVLNGSATTLSDVVVVGYGKTSRKSLSSAITTIKPEEMNKGAISDVGQLLQGKVPGLNITASASSNTP